MLHPSSYFTLTPIHSSAQFDYVMYGIEGIRSLQSSYHLTPCFHVFLSVVSSLVEIQRMLIFYTNVSKEGSDCLFTLYRICRPESVC